MARFPRPDMVSEGEKGEVVSRHHNASSFDGRPVVAGTTYGLEELGYESKVDPKAAGKVKMDKVKF